MLTVTHRRIHKVLNRYAQSNHVVSHQLRLYRPQKSNVSTALKRDSIGRQYNATSQNDEATATQCQTKAQHITQTGKHRNDSDDELEAHLPADFPLAKDAMALEMAAQISERDTVENNVAFGDPLPMASSTKATGRVRSRPPTRGRPRAVDTRSRAVQAAAFANRISDMANMPTSRATPPAELAHCIRLQAAWLSNAAHEPHPHTAQLAQHASMTYVPSSSSQASVGLGSDKMTRESFTRSLSAGAQSNAGGTRQPRTSQPCCLEQGLAIPAQVTNACPPR